jgi:hypothetical protein
VGRYGETAVWVVVALIKGPRTIVGLLDAVRDFDGRVGPGRLLGAVARLERLGLIVPAPLAGGPLYRLSSRLLPGASASPTIQTSTEVPSA